MLKIELKVVKADKGLIEAPEVCPFYKSIPNEEVYQSTRLDFVPSPSGYRVIHASICRLCKLCEFYTSGDETVLLAEDYHKLVDILTSKEFLTTVMNQVRFLQKNDRIPLAILISFETLRNAAYQAFEGSHFDKKLAALSNSNALICVVAGLPLYFSEKLTRSPVQVVGEVEWSN